MDHFSWEDAQKQAEQTSFFCLIILYVGGVKVKCCSMHSKACLAWCLRGCHSLFNRTTSRICFHMSHGQAPLSARLDWLKKFTAFLILRFWLAVRGVRRWRAAVRLCSPANSEVRQTTAERLYGECFYGCLLSTTSSYLLNLGTSVCFRGRESETTALYSARSVVKTASLGWGHG